LSASSFDAPNELWAATYIVRRTALQIWQVSDSITISTNTHPIRTLTWVVPTSWADAANGPLARVNIYGIVTMYEIKIRVLHRLYQQIFKQSYQIRCQDFVKMRVNPHK
jgi:hypothetical protein